MKWAEVIDAAEKRGCFTSLEIAEASCWATCALGEQRSTRSVYLEKASLSSDRRRALIAPGGYYGEEEPEWWRTLNRLRPVENVLANLGAEFYLAVEHHDFFSARTSLTQLEEKWSELGAAGQLSPRTTSKTMKEGSLDFE